MHDLESALAAPSPDVCITSSHAWLPDYVRERQNLPWIHLLSAGANRLLGMDLHVERLRVRTSSGVHSATIAEYVMAGVLFHVKQFGRFVEHQRERRRERAWLEESEVRTMAELGLGALAGTQSVVPDLYLTYASSDISNSCYTIDYPISLVVDVDGRLFVGNYDYEVSRFDDALALSSYQTVEASTYLVTGIDYNYMVALDQSGALWIGHYDGELVRLPNPMSYTGYADVSGDLDLELTWLTDAGTGSPDGGTLTFIPTQGPHAGY